MHIVYFTSNSGNTRRFVEKLDHPATQIKNGLIIDEPFILFMPTYADTSGANSVCTPIKNFLNIEINRRKMVGVVGFGNKNFGQMFAIGSNVVSIKCGVPLLHKVELFGTQDDVRVIEDRIRKYDNRT